jgi:ankyrin repeat protein
MTTKGRTRLVISLAASLLLFGAAFACLYYVSRQWDSSTLWNAIFCHHDYSSAKIILALRPSLANQPYENYGGRSPLWWACWEGYDQEALFLLRHGARADYTDYDGTTCLHAVAQGCRDVGSVALVVALLEQGADPSAKDDKGRTPFKVAVEAGNTEVADFLRKLRSPRRGAGQ